MSAEDRFLTCKCGKILELDYFTTGNDYWFGHCLACNRKVEIDGACWPFKESIHWEDPREHFKCEKCSGEFFAHKILERKIVDWIRCIQCGFEKDFRDQKEMANNSYEN